MAPIKQSLVLRKAICVLLGILFGVICVALASTSVKDIWGSPLMWSIIWNRMLIGVVIFVAGTINYHAILKIRFFPWLRGAACGLFVSVGPAIGSMIGGQYMPEAVWGTMIAGTIYGLIIDVIATKFAGDGRAILGEWSR